MNTRPIYWLHLSDLHFGAPGKEVLNQAIAEFFQALRAKSSPSRPISSWFRETWRLRANRRNTIGPMDFSPTCAARSQKSTTRVIRFSSASRAITI